MKRLIIFTIFICAALAAGARAQGIVSGRLLKSNGKALQYTEIELVAIGSRQASQDPRLLAVSGTDGRFRFGDVPSGNYTLSINFNEPPTDLSPYPTYFFPAAELRSDARQLEITGRERFDKLDFKLPPAFEQSVITGRVEFSGGAPAVGAWIALRDVVSSKGMMAFGATKTNADGIFSLKAFAGREYQVGALAVDPAAVFSRQFFDPLMFLGAAETEVFVSRKSAPALRLVIRESKEIQRLRERYEAFTPIPFADGIFNGD